MNETSKSPQPTPERAQPMTTIMKIWECKIGEVDRSKLPSGSDWPMRQAIQEAYTKLTGEDALFIFSGWAGELNEGERAVVENRLPNCPKCNRPHYNMEDSEYCRRLAFPLSESGATEGNTEDAWVLVYDSALRNPTGYIINGEQTIRLIDNYRAVSHTVGNLAGKLAKANYELQDISDFAIGNGDVCEIIAKRARAALHGVDEAEREIVKGLTLEQIYLLSQRFNASCTAPGVTSVTQDEAAINEWLKEIIRHATRKEYNDGDV